MVNNIDHFKYLFLGGAKSQTGVCVKYNTAYMGLYLIPILNRCVTYYI